MANPYHDRKGRFTSSGGRSSGPLLKVHTAGRAADRSGTAGPVKSKTRRTTKKRVRSAGPSATRAGSKMRFMREVVKGVDARVGSSAWRRGSR